MGAVLYPRSHAPAWGGWARIGAMGVAALAGLAQAASLALPGTG